MYIKLDRFVIEAKISPTRTELDTVIDNRFHSGTAWAKIYGSINAETGPLFMVIYNERDFFKELR